MTSNFFLADNNGAPWAVNGDWLDTATVTAQGLNSRQTRRTRGGDFLWPPAGTSDGHQRGLSHGHGQYVRQAYWMLWMAIQAARDELQHL